MIIQELTRPGSSNNSWSRGARRHGLLSLHILTVNCTVTWPSPQDPASPAPWGHPQWGLFSPSSLPLLGLEVGQGPPAPEAASRPFSPSFEPRDAHLAGSPAASCFVPGHCMPASVILLTAWPLTALASPSPTAVSSRASAPLTTGCTPGPAGLSSTCVDSDRCLSPPPCLSSSAPRLPPFQWSLGLDLLSHRLSCCVPALTPVLQAPFAAWAPQWSHLAAPSSSPCRCTHLAELCFRPPRPLPRRSPVWWPRPASLRPLDPTLSPTQGLR